MLDVGIGWLQQRRFAQWRDRIAGLPLPQKLRSQLEQRRHLLRCGWVWRLGHGANLAWKLIAWPSESPARRPSLTEEALARETPGSGHESFGKGVDQGQRGPKLRGSPQKA